MTFELNKITRSTIKNLIPYSSARDEFKKTDKDIIFLDANENPFNDGLNRYPDPFQWKLKDRISKLKEIAVNQILLGNGSDEVLDLLVRAFCEPNEDEVIIMPPTYGMYKVIAQINAVAVKEVLLKDNFELDLPYLLSQINNKTKLIFICNPNNPTGNVFNPVQIEMILKNFSGIVVLDEAYIDFSNYESWLTRLNHFPNLVITQTLSKAVGLANIRLGICFASKDIISILNTIKPPYNVNGLTQKIAFERLNDQQAILKNINAIIRQRDWLVLELKKISFIKRIFPSQTNFLLIEVDDANLRYEKLVTSGIILRNRSLEPLCYNCLRLTIGTEKENKTMLTILKTMT